MRLNAYYYSFEATGEELVDRILSAVACAGKGYHNTSEWNEKLGGAKYEPFLRGDTFIEQIQNAADDAAEAMRALAALPPEQPAPLTVGAALADPRVQAGACVVEFCDGNGACRQARVSDRPESPWSRVWTGARWCCWATGVWGSEFQLPCRLVPLDQADADPAGRGGM